jgi:nicotinate-nucleotide adenylyltransferase
MKKDKAVNTLRRLGIMGGTFDPVHNGHLVAAEAVRQEFNLDKVVFIPAGRPPHKNADLITNPEHRYIMTALATASNEYFEVSRIEVEKTEISYTVDTIKDLRTKYGEAVDIFFITGADSVLELLTWHKAEELLKLCSFIAVTRPGFDKGELEQKVYEIKSKYNGEIISIEVPLLEISSTDIRERVREGKSIKYLLPSDVEKYIEKNGLYKE